MTSDRPTATEPLPGAAGDIVIAAENVTLSLGRGDARVDILKGVDLRVAAGERLAILGPSGSGKSSLMAVLSGLEQASGGRIMVAGADMTGLGEDGLAEARRGRIGIVLQAFHLIPTMTALENVAVPLELAGHPDPLRAARDELEAVGLAQRTGHYPAQLSGGEQQRVALARALGPRPRILFADEPTGNLDAATGETIVALMFRRLQETGATLVLITHDSGLAARCDRIITMRDGRIVSDSPVERAADRVPA
ncbi:ABC transporter ATP-binding protein [Thermaurantiacus sp.]